MSVFSSAQNLTSLALIVNADTFIELVDALMFLFNKYLVEKIQELGRMKRIL